MNTDLAKCMVITIFVTAFVLWRTGAHANDPSEDVSDLFFGVEQTDSNAAPAPTASSFSTRGVLEPAAQAVISSGLAARILDLPFKEGDAFLAGETLAAFDCRLFDARRAQALASLKAAQARLDNALQLQRTEAIGSLEVALARAERQGARAAFDEATVVTDGCIVNAPYDGRVVETYVNTHETAAPGDNLLSIVSAGPLEATLLAPSAWLVWVRPGQRFAFKVDETGAVLEGSVVSVGARVDPVGRNVSLRVVLSEDADGLTPGMSGTAVFRRPGASGPNG